MTFIVYTNCTYAASISFWKKGWKLSIRIFCVRDMQRGLGFVLTLFNRNFLTPRGGVPLFTWNVFGGIFLWNVKISGRSICHRILSTNVFQMYQKSLGLWLSLKIKRYIYFNKIPLQNNEIKSWENVICIRL